MTPAIKILPKMFFTRLIFLFISNSSSAYKTEQTPSNQDEILIDPMMAASWRRLDPIRFPFAYSLRIWQSKSRLYA
tara:strand:+ start:36 stop:263 length:228 start_codon:yes stop_codon:yes gene_type:complete